MNLVTAALAWAAGTSIGQMTADLVRAAAPPRMANPVVKALARRRRPEKIISGAQDLTLGRSQKEFLLMPKEFLCAACNRGIYPDSDGALYYSSHEAASVRHGRCRYGKTEASIYNLRTSPASTLRNVLAAKSTIELLLDQIARTEEK